MLKKGILLILCAAMVMAASGSFAQLPERIIGDPEDGIDGVYHQNFDRVLFPDTVYVIQGMYYVDSTYTLTIHPGTIIKGDTATVQAYGGTLVIKRGAKIYAFGNECDPIVMTSRRLPGDRGPGDWGGLVLLGAAPVNKVNPLIEGGIVEGTFGGDKPHDSSGTLQYVRVEFAGFRYQLNNEINGMTMGGVGDGTVIHHVQVSYAFDDSYEWFGGTVNVHHMIAYAGTDDDFDTDFGYNGRIQFGFGLRDINYYDAQGESHGWESDNDGSNYSGDTPITSAVSCNMTWVGPARTNAYTNPDSYAVDASFDFGGLTRRASQFSVFNSANIGYPQGLSMRNDSTHAYACYLSPNERLQVKSLSYASFSVSHDAARWPVGAPGCPIGVVAWFSRPDYHNYPSGSSVRMPDAVGLTNMSDIHNPNPVPIVGTELDTAYVEPFTNPKLAGFEPTDYRGAFEPGVPMASQWTACWANFDPQNTPYPDPNDPYWTGAGQTPNFQNSLGQNYPNPFNPSTMINYTIKEHGFVSLKIYNIAGQLVKTLVSENQAPRSEGYKVQWNGLNDSGNMVSSGVYFYKLVTNNFSQTKKMVFLK